jgi:arginyl-tRNA--protein-N-Asp/Glu arginylyltransferase
MNGNSMRASLNTYSGFHLQTLIQIMDWMSNNRANFMRLEKFPQRPALSRCEACVSWNLARPALRHPRRAPFQFIQKQLPQRRLSWAQGGRANRQSEAEFLRQHGPDG